MQLLSFKNRGETLDLQRSVHSLKERSLIGISDFQTDTVLTLCASLVTKLGLTDSHAGVDLAAPAADPISRVPRTECFATFQAHSFARFVG
jgi:hypothetical protein